MHGFSYNLTPGIKLSLEKIEILRQKIAFIPIPPKSELNLRWNALLERIYYSSRFENFLHFEKKDIQSILVFDEFGKVKKKDDLFVVKYKEVFDLLNNEILGIGHMEKKEFTLKIIRLFVHSPISLSFQKLLDFLETSSDHPFIKSAAIWMGFLHESRPQYANSIACLLSYIYLYASAYNFRGLLVMEENIAADQETYREKIEQTKNAITLTDWIDFYISAQIVSLEKIWDKLKNQPIQTKPRFSVSLNDRQKHILKLLDDPNLSITNRKVQKLFGISQITSSRDLSTLASYGLIFSHGHGRSVFYTKV
jgi:hypothetical protein